MVQSDHGQAELLSNVALSGSEADASFDLHFHDGQIEGIDSCAGKPGTDSVLPKLVAPSLCHPHVHIDKAFILSHPRYRHLQVQEGTFKEAMDLTSKAKESFTIEDLLERGQRLINESNQAGVTHMRAFVEIDEIVGLKCLEAGVGLKRRARDKGLCHVQLCAFAQLPLKPLNESGEKIRLLMRQAMQPEYEVDVVGSTPYVEEDRANEVANAKWMVDLALEHGKHLDFHLDYNVNSKTEPLIFELIRILKRVDWKRNTDKTIVLGHCTRLIYFDKQQWADLKTAIGDLPISFVGLPTSDLYMMKTPQSTGASELRTTLPIPQMIQEHGFNCAIGMNNIGNAFTPQGTCDPLFLAHVGVGVYQTGTVQGAQLLYECISTRARAAIGLARAGDDYSLDIKVGQPADLVIFDNPSTGFKDEYPRIEDKVYYYNSAPRQTIWSKVE